MNSSDLTEASFGKPRTEKNTVADKPIKEDETGTCAQCGRGALGELGPSGERTKHQRDRCGRRSRQRPRNTCGSSTLSLPVQDPSRQPDVQKASAGASSGRSVHTYHLNYLLSRHSLSIYYVPGSVWDAWEATGSKTGLLPHGGSILPGQTHSN